MKRLTICFFVVSCLAACSGLSLPEGEEGAICSSTVTCNSGLTCDDGVCVPLDGANFPTADAQDRSTTPDDAGAQTDGTGSGPQPDAATSPGDGTSAPTDAPTDARADDCHGGVRGDVQRVLEMRGE